MRLLTITYYKLKMMMNDRLFFAAMVIIPLFITVATGYALRYRKLNVIPIAVVDEDVSDYSTTLLKRLSGKEGIRVLVVSRAEALKMLEGNEVEGIFIIKDGFGKKITEGNTMHLIDMASSPSSFSAEFTGEVVAGEVMRFITSNKAADWILKQYSQHGKPVSGSFAAEVIEFADSQWEPEPLMTIEYTESDSGGAYKLEGISLPASTATSAGLVIVFIMLYVLFSSGWLIEERRNGTLKRIASGPGAVILSFAGSVLSLTISGMLLIILFSIINKVIFGIDLFPGMLSYVVFFAYLLSVISISMLLSSLLKTPAQLQSAAPIFALLTGFAGGCFWNFVEMPKHLDRLAMLTPQGWALKGINRLLVNPKDISVIILPVVVLLLIPLFLLPLSYCFVSRSVNS